MIKINKTKILKFNLALLSAIVLVIVLLAVNGSSERPESNNSDTIVEENKTNETTTKENEAAEAARAKQTIVDRYAPEYCSKKQGTKVVLSDTGKNNGWISNDGSGWTAEECSKIISMLYDSGARDKELDVVMRGNYGIGMQEMSLLYSLGSPDNINNTHFSDKTKSQYVYGDTYIYTEFGVVTAVQN